ncbi:MAG: threonine synthase [Eubacteriales bacterium]|mgnify:FL=1|nr:threonine synthase [Eubacteriales bacterium]MDD4421412.1 threonine synthase [Eubacteriales bacterium]HBR30774.1 threonine synthase [Clostridiales bacterium]
MNYISTRGGVKGKKTSAYVIKQGLADDGGLYVPEQIPALSEVEMCALSKMNYIQKASYILGLFLTDYTEEELNSAAAAAYGSRKFPSLPVGLSQVNGDFILELWHGPTSAFKDMALQIMPHLLSLALKKTGEDKNALILVATSGDTGKAALEGYADADRVSIQVFYPIEGVSGIQKKQMACQRGKNVMVTAIKGNFDDAQSGVKEIFADRDTEALLSEKGLFLSSANSINWGRLAPQIVYYISAYCELMRLKRIKYGDLVNVTVPTGNFGNILACYIAKKMGVPIGKIICASNSNNVLTDFLNTGVYDKRRTFYTTISPSMDILISSNLERLLFMTAGAKRCSSYMKNLSEKGFFEVDNDVIEVIRADICGFYCGEENTKSTIASYFNKYNYLPDTHTAVALFCAGEYKKKSGDDSVMLIASTASPYKFAPAVLTSLGAAGQENDFEAIRKLNEISGIKIPTRLAALESKKPRFNTVIEKSDMKREVLRFASEQSKS